MHMPENFCHFSWTGSSSFFLEQLTMLRCTQVLLAENTCEAIWVCAYKDRLENFL